MASAFDLLTSKQKKVYSAIESYIKTKGIPPTVREIGEMIGEKTPGAVQGILNRLQQKNVITRREGMARSIQLVTESTIYAECVYVPEIKKITRRNVDDILNIYNVKKYHPLSADMIPNAESCFLVDYASADDESDHIGQSELLLISSSEKLSQGDMAAVLLNGRFTLVHYDGKSLDASCENSIYYNIQPEGEREIRLLGKLLGKYCKAVQCQTEV